MKILLLSCSTGEGHNSAAKAVSDALSSQGVEWELHDILNLLSPRVAKLLYKVLEQAEALLRDPQQLRAMEQRLRQDFNQNGSAVIAKHIIAAVEAHRPMPV